MANGNGRRRLTPSVESGRARTETLVSTAAMNAAAAAVAAVTTAKTVTAQNQETLALLKGWMLGIYDVDGNMVQVGLLARITYVEKEFARGSKWLKAGAALALLIALHSFFGVDFAAIFAAFLRLVTTAP